MAVQITVLGSNGWYSSEMGLTTCILVESEKYYIILDAGDGFSRLPKYLTDPNKKVLVFLSHLHLDHISGLHTLMNLSLPQGMTIYCEGFVYDTLGHCLNPASHNDLMLIKVLLPPYTLSSFDVLPTQVDIKPVYLIADSNEKLGVHNKGWVSEPLTKCRRLDHGNVSSLGYAMVADGKKIVFCTDTKPCDAVVDLAKDTDVLIAECGADEQHKDQWPHLTPKQAAEIAKRAGVGQLLLMHFTASIYNTPGSRWAAWQEARQIFSNTQICWDKDKFVF